MLVIFSHAVHFFIKEPEVVRTGVGIYKGWEDNDILLSSSKALQKIFLQSSF